MPGRRIPLVTGQIYHIYNRGVDSLPTFFSKRDFEHFLLCLWYYHFSSVPFKLSRFFKLSVDDRLDLERSISYSSKNIDVLCFCLMNTHFHLLVRQNVDGAISKCIGDVLNSYTKYFNSKHHRTGPLFGGRYKAVHIASEEQLIHVSRYIHLNPYTGYLVSNMSKLLEYPWSSLGDFVSERKATHHELVSKETIQSLFKTKESHLKFVVDHSAYQRELGRIKHLLCE